MLSYEEREKLLRRVMDEVKNDPTLFRDIVNACNQGTIEAIRYERQRAADMETIAVGFQSLTNGRYREKSASWMKGLILGKLQRWNEDSYLGGWDEVMKRLEEELKNDDN